MFGNQLATILCEAMDLPFDTTSDANLNPNSHLPGMKESPREDAREVITIRSRDNIGTHPEPRTLAGLHLLTVGKGPQDRKAGGG